MSISLNSSYNPNSYFDFSGFSNILDTENYTSDEKISEVVVYLLKIDYYLNNNKTNHKRPKLSDEVESTLSQIKEKFVKVANFKGYPKLIETILRLDCLNAHLNFRERMDIAKQSIDPETNRSGLQEFDTHKAELTDANLKEIVDCFPQLRSLNIRRCSGEMTRGGFKNLKKLTYLVSLNMSMIDKLENEDLAHVPSSVTSLALRRCKKISTQGMKNLSTPELRSLVIRGCDIDNDSLKEIAEKFKQLFFLDLHRCPKVTDGGLFTLAESELAGRIRIFSLRDNKSVTDRGINYITSKFVVLQDFIIGGCTKLTNQSLVYVARRCKELEKFDVRENLNITDAGLSLLRYLPKLRELRTEGSSQISKEGLQPFFNREIQINRQEQKEE